MTFKEELKQRGLINNITNEEEFDKLLVEKATIYCGFDPTAPSLHIGHLVLITLLARFQKEGHKVLPLVGGGTGIIGDPSFRNSSRKLLTLETAGNNVLEIKKQLSRFISFSEDRGELLNNYDWLGKLSFIDFLSIYGIHFPVNYMLAKDTVSSRLESGLTYTEFTYMIIQALDFYHLYTEKNCKIQAGGSDQWGNITSGIELIHRKVAESTPVGLTVPLILKSDGTKFGKSANGSLWLDSTLTTPYELYQYFLNISDQDVIHYLKVFTFLPLDEIAKIAEESSLDLSKRYAQKVLAKELVTLIHSNQDAVSAQQMSEVLFTGEFKNLTLQQLEICFAGIKSIDTTIDTPLINALVELGACTSNRDARENITNGAVTINGDKVTDINYVLEKANAIENTLFIIKKGKKNYFLVRFKSL